MAHISGYFQHAKPGRLLIKLSGTYYEGAYRDSGFPSGGASGGNILVRPGMGPSAGSLQWGEPIDRYAPVTQFEMDYPGGNASWLCVTQEVAHQNPGGGLYSYGMSNLVLDISLRMK